MWKSFMDIRVLTIPCSFAHISSGTCSCEHMNVNGLNSEDLCKFANEGQNGNSALLEIN